MFEKQIAKGIRFLNSINPGWVDKINLDKLNMANASNCIIGQVYGNYFIDMPRLEKDYGFVDRFDYGFGCNLDTVLTKEWKQAIINIRTNQSTSILDVNPENHNSFIQRIVLKIFFLKLWN